jgi:Protein required for attachment to host cells
MPEKLIVIIDHRHFKIFSENREPGQLTPNLTLIDSLEVVDGHGSYADTSTDMAGRFPGSKGRAPYGMSIDERLPMKEEQQRRIIEEISTRLDAFLQARPNARWDFAAASGHGLHQAVLERLSPAVRQRLGLALQKDLTNVPTPQLLAHFRTSLAGARS